MKTCMSLACACAATSVSLASNPVATLDSPKLAEPVSVATVRRIDGKLVRISDWVPYHGSGAREVGTTAFDAFPADDSCGGGTKGSWWFGADANIPMMAEDISFDAAFGGTTINTYSTAWAYQVSGGTPIDTSFGLVVFCYNEMIDVSNCGPGIFPDDFTPTSDGFIANFGQLPQGNWYSNIDALNDLGVLMPDGGEGTYEQLLLWIDDISGDISLCPGPCGPFLWGTSDDDGTGNRPGTNDIQALLAEDGEPYGDCFDMSGLASCPDPLAQQVRFQVKAGGDTCSADHDGDGFLTGIDYDLFVADYEAGCLDNTPPCTNSADYDNDGFITGIDFDLYVADYENGCL